MSQDEAMRLANELDAYHTAPHHKQAAAELRRLSEALAALAAPVQEPVETWEDLHNALQRIDTAAVGLPTFQVRHEGGLDAVVQNIVDAIVALHEDRTTPPAAQRTWVGLTPECRKQLIQEGWSEYIAGIDDGKTFGEWMSVATETKLKEKNT